MSVALVSLRGTSYGQQRVGVAAALGELSAWEEGGGVSVGWTEDAPPSVFQRRRSAEDELAMRGFLQEGDLISVSCTVPSGVFLWRWGWG